MPTPLHSLRRVRRAAPAVACALAFAAAVDASASPPPAPEWEVEIAPYGWLVMASGRVDTRRGTERFTIDAHDVLSSLDLGAMGAVKGRWWRFVFLTDVAWAKLSSDDEIQEIIGGGQVNFDITNKLGWFEALGGYRVYERPGGLFGAPSPTERQIFSVDLLAGITYSWIDVRLKVSREPILPIPQRERTFEPATNWVAPYLAARLIND